MNALKVIEKLKEEYPGKSIVSMPENDPKEIVCEVDPESGFAISVIDTSAPHYHKKMTEEYKVIGGELNVYVDGKEHLLKEGDTLTITPGAKHHAIGDETWIEVTSDPPWTPEDHILLK